MKLLRSKPIITLIILIFMILWHMSYGINRLEPYEVGIHIPSPTEKYVKMHSATNVILQRLQMIHPGVTNGTGVDMNRLRQLYPTAVQKENGKKDSYTINLGELNYLIDIDMRTS